MSTAIKRVSTTNIPGEEPLDREGHDYKPLPPRVTDGHYFDARVPADIIDRVRRDARNSVYPNSTVEADTIRKTDEAVFEKVRILEDYQIGQAQSMLERNKGRVGAALSYVDQIDALRERLRAGEDTKVIAKEFNALEGRIRNREISLLQGMAGEAETVEAALADPVGNAQHILHLMPLDFGRTAGLVRN
ncbi:hypothetical protein [Microbacterium pumilum]|uniref:Uncharacterized protein n=1 Tax=Microbacterium pumilum TaxID=344165 RepID=A0ABN2T2D8_9MICO